jgi:hypothetical protein
MTVNVVLIVLYRIKHTLCVVIYAVASHILALARPEVERVISHVCQRSLFKGYSTVPIMSEICRIDLVPSL